MTVMIVLKVMGGVGIGGMHGDARDVAIRQGRRCPVSPGATQVGRHLDLGVGYLRNGDYRSSKEKLNRAMELDPKNAQVLSTFGLLFQLEGENELAEEYFKNAIKWEKKAIEFATNTVKADYRKRLRLYEAGKPYRE